MWFNVLRPACAGAALALAVFVFPVAGAQEKPKAPEPIEIKFKAGSQLDNSGWSSESSGLMVATDSAGYSACWALLGAGNPKLDPAPYDDKYVYVFAFGGFTNYKPGIKVAITGITRNRPAPNIRIRDVLTVHVTVTEPDGPRDSEESRSPCVVARIERKSLEPAIGASTRILLRESRVSRILKNSIDPKFYAPGGRWLVSYNAGQGKKAAEAVKAIGMKVVEDYERGSFLLVEVTRETRLAEIDRLPRRNECIVHATPNFRVCLAGSKGK